MKYSFEVQWPAPFVKGWKVSSFRFENTDDAAKALADYLAVSAQNGVMMEARLVKLPE